MKILAVAAQVNMCKGRCRFPSKSCYVAVIRKPVPAAICPVSPSSIECNYSAKISSRITDVQQDRDVEYDITLGISTELLCKYGKNTINNNVSLNIDTAFAHSTY